MFIVERRYQRFRILQGLNDAFNLCVLAEDNFSGFVIMQYVEQLRPQLVEIVVHDHGAEQRFISVPKPNYKLSIVHGAENFFILGQSPGAEYIGWLGGVAERCFGVRRFREHGVSLVNYLDQQQRDWLAANTAQVDKLLEAYPAGVLALSLLSVWADTLRQDQTFAQYNLFKYQPNSQKYDKHNQ